MSRVMGCARGKRVVHGSVPKVDRSEVPRVLERFAPRAQVGPHSDGPAEKHRFGVCPLT